MHLNGIMQPNNRNLSLIFISDLHLHPNHPELIQALSHFFENKITSDSYLFILGDLFETWLGDDSGLQLYHEVISLLARQSKKGSRIYFMHGNRDFLVGSDFSKVTGVTLIPDYYKIELGEHKILLLHGDTLCTKDEDYQKFRQLVRNPKWKINFLAKTVDERETIAQNYRQQSKVMSAQKKGCIMDVSEEEVMRQMRNHNCDVMIHGHTHRPKIHCYRSTQYSNLTHRIVLGDWHEHYHYLQWGEKGPVQLVKHLIKENREIHRHDITKTRATSSF